MELHSAEHVISRETLPDFWYAIVIGVQTGSQPYRCWFSAYSTLADHKHRFQPALLEVAHGERGGHGTDHAETKAMA